MAATNTIDGQLLTEAEAARFLHIAPRTIINWRNAGKIPYIRIGGRSIRYRPESLRAQLEKLEMGGSR